MHKHILQNARPVLLKTAKTIKRMGSLRNCHSLVSRLKIVWSPRGEPGTEKGYQVQAKDM